MPKAYWIAHVEVRDPERYKDYVSAAGPAFAEFGATILARGGTTVGLEGIVRPRNVVIEFPSLQAAEACYASPAYQGAKAIRITVAEADLVIVEGVEG